MTEPKHHYYGDRETREDGRSDTTPAAVELLATELPDTNWQAPRLYRAADTLRDLSSQLKAANQRAEMLADSVAKAHAQGKAEGLRDYRQGFEDGCAHMREDFEAGMRLGNSPADTPAKVTVQDSFVDLVTAARAEAEKAMRKFPQPNYVLLKVAEEAGEVVKAGVHFAEGRETRENVEAEMRQTIAMLYRLWVEGDEVNGVHAIAGGRDEQV